MKQRIWITFAALAFGLCACTHQKVRISQTTDTQLSCAALRNELARVEQARAEIDSKTGFSGRNVGMALVFWPGIIVNESQQPALRPPLWPGWDRLNQLYYERGCLEKERRH